MTPLSCPSRWYENSPNVILEAFAAGKPVIAANQGGMAEMVRDGVDGLLFAPGNRDALYDALRRLCVEPDLLSQLRSGIVPPHSVDDEMRREEQSIRELLNEHFQLLSQRHRQSEVRIAEPH